MGGPPLTSKPKEFTPSGEAKIDESILESLSYPEAKMMAEAFRTNKMIGQLSEGQNGWLHMEKQGKLHGILLVLVEWEKVEMM